jgi:hypothetical protein
MEQIEFGKMPLALRLCNSIFIVLFVLNLADFSKCKLNYVFLLKHHSWPSIADKVKCKSLL